MTAHQRETTIRCAFGGFLVLLILAIIPWTAEPTGPIKEWLYQAAAAAALCIWALSRALGPWTILRASGTAWLFTAFIVLLAGATLFSPNKGHGAAIAIQFTALYVLYLAAAVWLCTPERVWSLFRWLCWGMIAASVYGFVQHLGHDPFPWDAKVVWEYDMLRQAPSTLGNPNVASHVLVLAITAAAGLFFLTRNPVYALLVAVFGGHFLLTRTRGSFLALAAAGLLTLFSWWSMRTFTRPWLKLAFPIGATAVLGMVAVAAGMAYLNASTGSPFPHDRSIVLRYQAFDGAARMVQESLLMGAGPGSYEILNPPYWTDYEQRVFAQQQLYNDHVHNEPLEWAVEAGIPAAVLYILVVLMAAMHGLRMAATDGQQRVLGLTFAAFFLAFFVDGLFGFNFHTAVSSVVFVFALGALTGLNHGPMTPQVAKRPAALRGVCLVSAAAILATSSMALAGEIMKQRGRGAAAQGATTAAQKALVTATRLQPHDWTAHYLLGHAEFTLGQPQRAARSFERAVTLHPNFVPAHAALARAELGKIRRGEATALDRLAFAVNRVRELSPYSPQAYDLMGRMYMVRASGSGDPEDWRRASDAFERAIALGAGKSPTLYPLLAQARVELGDLAGAEQALTAHMGLLQWSREDWRVFMGFAEQTGRYAALLNCLDVELRRALRDEDMEDTNAAVAAMVKAEALEAAGYPPDEVVTAFHQGLRAQPSSLEVWDAFYWFASRKDRMEDVFSALQTAAESREGLDAPASQVIRIAADAVRNRSQHEQLLELASGLAATAAALQTRKEHVLWAGELLIDLARNWEIPAHQGRLYCAIGSFYGALGAFEDAVTVFEEALDLVTDADRVICLRGLASGLIELERYDDALVALQDAGRIDPNDFTVRRLNALALARAGRAAEARLEYMGLLSLPGLPVEIRRQLEEEFSRLP